MSFQDINYSRRSFVRVGLSSLLGLAGLPLLSQVQANDQSQRRIKNCIFLYMNGGPSHIDTFDPKPNSLAGGDFKSIKTAVKELNICEHLPQLAEQASHLTVIRSMSSREGNHNRARYLVHTGYSPQGSMKHPGLGSIIASNFEDIDYDLPHYITIGFPSYGGGALGANYDPFFIRNPSEPISNLIPPSNIGGLRFNHRLSLLGWTDQQFIKKYGKTGSDHKEVYQQALKLMNSPLTSTFDLENEPKSVREAYGHNSFGQGCLMARRMIESGVKFIEVSLNGWDTHTDNFTETRNLMDQLDPAFAMLVKDLSQRDKLDETLIIWMGEFGRTPRINRNDGRDHHPQAWSAVLAGGGIRSGQVIGRTDQDGHHVISKPTPLPDLFATISSILGIDPTDEYFTPDGRPVALVDKGIPIREIQNR